MHEALLYTKEPDKSARCYLCRHRCHIKAGQRGVCQVRENIDGALYSILYGRPCSVAIDPIEKKPFFHFWPGSHSLSIATLGCNFQCPFCQNWEISQYKRAQSTEHRVQREVSSDEIVKRAIENGCQSISYTYTEPTIFYEYARDIAELARQRGLKNNFVTNGYMTREMLDDMRPLLDAANVDLKAFKEKTYRTVMKADLKGVLDSIQYMKELGIWVEVTTLIVPGMNDDIEELKSIAEFIAGVGKEIPWHISRFYPHYKMTDLEPTPIKIMCEAHGLGKKAGLRYVYMGNVPGDETENTFCWNCGTKLIERFGFSVGKNIVSKDGTCPKCGAKIDGVGLA